MVKYEEFLDDTMKEIRFEDAFDITELQELQDVLAKSLDIASIITDLDGKPITKPSNFCTLCQEFVRTTENGLKQCMYSDSIIGSNKNGYTVSKCLSAGLLDAGVAIMVGDKHVANWLFGQICDEYETYNLTELREKANELGIDEEAFIDAYKKVPVISRERFENIAQLVYMMSRQMAEQAYHVCAARADKKYRELLDDELEQQKRIAEHEFYLDELTQLNNRNYFEKQVERLDMSEIVPIAFVVGDVNYLKLTNDIFGHRHGDWLLSQIAEVLKDESFEGYIICRCGGDEFNVLIPKGNRQDAEWYCKRVNIELAKRFDCCFRPSIAFGIGKKSHPQEKIKNLLEYADLKMYKEKALMKERESLLDNLKSVLLGRGYITGEYHAETIALARRFAEYLKYDEPEVKRLTRIVRIQDYGYVALPRELFNRRFEENLPLEIRREFMKHPRLGSRIANLDEGYSAVSDEVLAHEEHWDGSGCPNSLSGEEIPVLSRISKIIADYAVAVEQAPIGRGMTREEAVSMLEQGSGSIYDPQYIEHFIEFLEQEKG